MTVQKGRQKSLQVSNFSLLWGIFKSHHGSEGAKTVNNKNGKTYISTGHKNRYKTLS